MKESFSSWLKDSACLRHIHKKLGNRSVTFSYTFPKRRIYKGSTMILARFNNPFLILLLGAAFLCNSKVLAQTDTTPPGIISLDPVDNTTNVTTRPNVSAVFDETLVRGDGLVQIRRADNDEVVGSFRANGTNRVRLSTTNVADDTLTINWKNELEEKTEYYIVLSAGSVTDEAENDFPGLGVADTGEWSFTTGDVREPRVVSLTPPDDGNNADPDGRFIVEFDEDVQAGTGNLTLHSGSQVRALEEGFNDTSKLSPTSVEQFSSNGIGSYFGINFGAGDGSGNWGGNDNPTNTTAYTGFDGNYFDASQLSTSPRNLDWEGIAISNLTNLAFSADFAAPSGWGQDDYIRVLVDIDNTGRFTEILEFRGDGDDIPREELTGDNLGDGVPLSTKAKRFHVPISGTGSTLDLRIVVRVSAGGERVAADNIVISGIANSPTLVEQVPISDASVGITGNTLSYDPMATLSLFTEYFIIIDDGAITDTSTNANVLNDLTASSAWNFATNNLGTIMVQKETSPDSASQSFTFTGDVSGSIQDGQQIVVSNLSPGTYSATEELPADWELSSIICDDSNSTGNLSTATANFNVEARETVSCTFTNTELYTLSFEKPLNGTVSSSGNEIQCGSAGSQCSSRFGNGTNLSLTPTPDNGFEFVAWGGDCSTNSVTISADTNCTALFKATQTIDFTPPASGTFGDSDTLSATATSTLPVSLASTTPGVCSIAGNIVAYEAVGTCTLTADQAGDDTYLPAPQVSADITVNKANQTITLNLPTSAFAGRSGSVDVAASSSLPVTLDTTTPAVCSVSGTTVSYLSAGTCTITANQAGDENYNSAPQVSDNILVNEPLPIRILSDGFE